MTTETNEIIRCPMCGAKNRVRPEQRVQTPVCGRCRTPLPTSRGSAAAASPIEVTDATFADRVERSAVPVLVDLWAPWCGPCRMLAPALEQVAREFAGRAIVAKLNVDDNPRTAARFNASSIPLLIVVKHGREVDRLVGLAPAAEIGRRLSAHL